MASRLLDELGVPLQHPFRARAFEALAASPTGFRDVVLLLLPVLWHHRLRPTVRSWALTYFRASVPLETDLMPFELRLERLLESVAHGRPYINRSAGPPAP